MQRVSQKWVSVVLYRSVSTICSRNSEFAPSQSLNNSARLIASWRLASSCVSCLRFLAGDTRSAGDRRFHLTDRRDRLANSQRERNARMEWKLIFVGRRVMMSLSECLKLIVFDIIQLRWRKRDLKEDIKEMTSTKKVIRFSLYLQTVGYYGKKRLEKLFHFFSWVAIFCFDINVDSNTQKNV